MSSPNAHTMCHTTVFSKSVQEAGETLALKYEMFRTQKQPQNSVLGRMAEVFKSVVLTFVHNVTVRKKTSIPVLNLLYGPFS